MAQYLRLCASTTMGASSIPGWGTKIPPALWCRQKLKQIKLYWSIVNLWSGKWQPTSVFFPGESHGQRNLASYSPWGRKCCRTRQHACHVVVNLKCCGLDEQQSDSVIHTYISIFSYFQIIFPYVLGLVAQLCLTACDPVDYSQPGSSVYGILQARALE